MTSTLRPDVLSVRHDIENVQITIELHIPPALEHFHGHFPGLAILPGVVQIDWAIGFARAYLPVAGEFSLMENIKFQALLLPEARVELELNWNAARARLEFTYTSGQRKRSSGRIVFSGNP